MTAPDHSVESSGRGGVSTVFVSFGLLGGLTVVLGFVLSLAEGATGAEHPWPRLSLLGDVIALRSEGVIGVGLALLLLLPVVRNVAVVSVLVRRRQWRAALLALVTMAAMLALYAFLSLRELLASSS